MSGGIEDMEMEERIKPSVAAAINRSTVGYYGLPSDARELQDLISHKNMNAQIGAIFRECYRYGQVGHSDYMRGINKILFYANAEKKRLQKAWEE